MEKFNKQKYDNEYAKHNYDRCIFNVPKGQKAIIEEHWKSKGYKSLNTYINDLIKKDMTESRENNIHVHDNSGKVIVGDINGNVNM